MNSIIKFSEYDLTPILEFKIEPTINFNEFIVNISKIDKKNIENYKNKISQYYKTYNKYVDNINDNTHLFEISDLTGDILNSNRVIFQNYTFTKDDMLVIKTNIMKYCIKELYSQLPKMLNIFGIEINTYEYINSESLKNFFNDKLNGDAVVEIIVNMTGFTFDKCQDDTYFFSNKNKL